ncbi:MAG: Crp/Fnr family transcriptional regulator [Alphaproteobacteria bacterium]|nr:MAG: Crp/Fnr family transcriptional regulator [Alphaproteobacteria bacterium]
MLILQVDSAMPRDQKAPTAVKTSHPAECGLCAVGPAACHGDPGDMPLRGLAREVGMPRGTPLIEQGEPARDAWFVKEGMIKATSLLPDGRASIIALLMPGDLFGLERQGRYLFGAEAAADSIVCSVPRTAFQELVDSNAKLRRRVLTMASHEIEAAQERLLTLGRRTAAERCASFLLWLERRLGPTDATRPMTLPISRQDIADYLGLTVETVSRSFSLLQRQKLIGLADRGQVVVIHDRDTLATLAG